MCAAQALESKHGEGVVQRIMRALLVGYELCEEHVMALAATALLERTTHAPPEQVLLQAPEQQQPVWHNPWATSCGDATSCVVRACHRSLRCEHEREISHCQRAAARCGLQR